MRERRSGSESRMHVAGNILLLAANYPPSAGGIQRVMGELALRLPTGSTVIAPEQPGDRDFDSNVPCTTRRVRLQSFHNFLAPAAIARQLLKFHRAPPRYIICDHVVTAAAVHLVRGIMPCPYSLFVYGRELNPCPETNGLHLRARLFGTVLRRAHRVFAISEFIEQRARSYNISESRLKRIPLGADFRRFIPSSSSNCEKIRSRHGLIGKPVIGTLGRVVERKGHDQVIRALPRMHEPVSRPALPDHRPRNVAIAVGAAGNGVGRRVACLLS